MLGSISKATIQHSLRDFNDKIQLSIPKRIYYSRSKNDSKQSLTINNAEIELRLLEAASESSKALRATNKNCRRLLDNSSELTHILSASRNSSSYVDMFEEWHEAMHSLRSASLDGEDSNTSESSYSEINMNNMVSRRSSEENNTHPTANTNIETQPNNKISDICFYSSIPFAAAGLIQQAVLLIHPPVNKNVSVNLLLTTYAIAGVLLILAGLFEKIPDQPSIAPIRQNEHELA